MSFASQNELLRQLIEFSAPLRRMLARRFNTDDVDDYLQETALRLLEGRGGDRIDQPRAYLTTTVRHLAIDQLRRRRFEVGWEHAEAGVLEQPDSDPLDQLCDDDQLRWLRDAVDQIRGQPKRALELRYFYHMSHREIAEAMGISPRTVEKHLARGLLECQRYLQDQES